MQTTNNHQVEADRALITALGGPAKVAERLRYQKLGGVQRVQNWTVRGIPAAVKVQHPDLFMRDLATPFDTSVGEATAEPQAQEAV